MKFQSQRGSGAPKDPGYGSDTRGSKIIIWMESSIVINQRLGDPDRRKNL